MRVLVWATAVSIGSAVAIVVIPAFLANFEASRLAQPVDRLTSLASRANQLAAERDPVAAYPEPAPLTPAAVPRGARQVDPPGTWDHPTWQALGLTFGAAHSFSFQFDSRNGPDEAVFECTARGDLDGDGETSTFWVRGWYRPGAWPELGPLQVSREVE